MTSAPSNPMARDLADLSGDRSIAYAQRGDGPDCLLIHGTLMTLEEPWLAIGPALADEFKVSMVDRPGHGLSKRRRLVDASPWRQAELLRELADVIGLQRPILVGHSFGGTVALAYALLYPGDIAGVVALAPMCLPEIRMEAVLFGPRGMPAIGDGLARMLGITSDPILLPTLWRAMFLPQIMPERFGYGFPFEQAAQTAQMIAEGEDAMALTPALMTMAMRYAGCHVPTRILGGTADIVVNNATQGAIAAALIPEATFTWQVGMGHMLHHFAQDAIIEAVRSFRR